MLTFPIFISENMASASSISNDVTVCSICFEKFRTPRILPCTHVFCHGCISSYIVTSCQSKVAPVGFSCPLCRKFVPSASAENNPEKWTDSLPECKILDKLNKQETNLCAACLRENEEEEATDICITCEESICGNCAKYHKRSLASKNHVIVSLTEPSAVLKAVICASLKNESCPVHPDKDIEIHCNDHMTVCCSLCVSTDHRKCADVMTIQSMAEKTKSEGNVKKLLRKMSNFEQELLLIKKKQEDNITALDTASDDIRSETCQLRKEINEHLDKLERKHLNEIAELTKGGRDVLSSTIDSLRDRIQFSRHCIESMQDIEGKSDACFLKDYHRVRESFEMLEGRTRNLEYHELKLKSRISKELRQIKNLKKFSENQVTHSKMNFVTRKSVDEVGFTMLCELNYPDYNICSGTFLSDDKIVLANFNSQKEGLLFATLKQNTWGIEKKIESSDFIFDVLPFGKYLYVTDRTTKSIIVLSNDTFTTCKELKIQDGLTPYGMSQRGKFLYVACRIAILKLDFEGEVIHKYPLEKPCFYMTVTKEGHIVYTYTDTHEVTCIDDIGGSLWKYTSSQLKSPHSVDRDSLDNLYVSGFTSNNVHILSCSGSLIRVIEDIPCPAFMKVNQQGTLCCVCSNWKNIRVYELK
ncbi:uncharacterized protein LOC111099702 [Crassostrea virginica]